ncbi:MAG: methanogenesis marker 3 protein [Candidatus Methanomethylophilaceae archaeon]|nr:methanogenesis marker 3 protein [Candidatus Methanomethylophilaceae archaeon]
MIVTVNGKEKKLKAGSTLKTAVAGEPYVKGGLVSVRLSEKKVVAETRDFEISTDAGTMVMRLDESPLAEKWRSGMMGAMADMNSRWVTHDIVAFGAFPSDLEVDRGTYRYARYECFLALGGFDNNTTYLMLARDSHSGSYGAGRGVIGRITVGRHILDKVREGDRITAVRPLMSETSTEDVVVTDDLSFKLDDGYVVETCVGISLDKESPESAEQLLVLAGKGSIKATESTGSYVACSEDLDVAIPAETVRIRDRGSVAVRCSGIGTGRLYIYKDRRQLSPQHNSAGKAFQGMAIVSKAPAGSSFAVITDPPRALAVGMTQAEGAEFLAKAGIRQIRTGDVSDDAIIAEQSPEHTMAALSKGEAETFGVPRGKVFKIRLSEDDPLSVTYFRKITGLNHKPVGVLKVQFTFEGLPMVTFYGDDMKGKNLYPQEPFKKVKRGDIGLTNQARPHHGLIGIRLQDSKEYGPTGEEPYGTNIIGRFADDLDRLMDGLKDDDYVYITEVDL